MKLANRLFLVRTRKPLYLAAALSAALTATGARAATVFEKDGFNLDLYGIIDVGFGYLEHSYAASDQLASTINSYNLNGSPNSFTGLYNGGLSMSRVGIQGSAGFGSGQKAFFRLESAVNTTYGTLANNGQAVYNNINGLHSANSASAINGQPFSRAAYVGFSDPVWGSVSAGRTVNLAFDQVVEFDPVQASLLYSPLGYSGGIGGGLGATENTRMNNSVRYDNTVGGLRLGAQYKFAGDKSSANAGYGWVGMVGYTQGPVSFEATYSQTYNTVSYPVQYSNVVAPDPDVQVENTKGFMVTALWKITDAATLKAGYENLDVYRPSNPNLVVQNYYGLIMPNASVNAAGEQHFSLGWVGGDYKFTKAFTLLSGYWDINTYNHPETGKAYLGQFFTLIGDYRFNGHFDAYAGTMIGSYSGAGLTKHAPHDAYSTNGLYGVGIRFRF